MNDESNALPPIVAPMPTTDDVTNSVKSTIKDSIKAVVVLSTMLRKLDLQGYAVADELLGNLQVAYAMADHLPKAAHIESLTREKADALEHVAKIERALNDSKIVFGGCRLARDTLRAELDAAKVAIKQRTRSMIDLNEKLNEVERDLRNLRAGETCTVEYDLSPAMVEGALRNKLIKLGWNPPKDTARSRATSGVDSAKLIGETGEKIG